MKLNVFWFRRDLRFEDNAALIEALNSTNKVIPIFIFDSNILSELREDDSRVSFIYSQLEKLQKKLVEYNSTIKIYHGDPLECWQRIISDYTIEGVFVNKDYSPYARKRDSEIKSFLDSQSIPMHFYKDQVIFEEGEIVKNDGNPYTVFTPYKNKWLTKFRERPIKKAKAIDYTSFFSDNSLFPSLESLGFLKSAIKVRNFSIQDLENYSKTRDYPSLDTTSYLSPHLRFGTISIREIILQLNDVDSVFISELIWREFFMQILFHFPHVVHANFRAKYDGIKWNNSELDFQKWCAGKTGYPLVDAGMRQLNQTGYMHNRVRMVTAGFLCKHLLIDWRWGEAYFASKLLDYELSSNNGNWQWAAGTGCDAAPYFRIFNPIEQLKKFDKEQYYIKKWVDEYGTVDYPEEMIDHKFARKRALDTYKEGLLK